MQDFAARLIAKMTEKGLKNPDVALATGVVPNTVSKWRSRLQKPDDEQMAKLADLLGETEAWLRYGPVEVDYQQLLRDGAFAVSRHARNLPFSAREYLAELRLRLVKAGATEEQIDEAFDLFKSPAVFSFYFGGSQKAFTAADVLNNVKTFAEESVLPTLRRRGLKV